MNSDWVNFLKSNNAFFSEQNIELAIDTISSHHSISALSHLSILKVSGSDASHFLQGQLTCNINETTEFKGFFAAFCNAKGRTICTLLILKTADEFLIVLPKDLIDKVSKKLQMYIMRSDVQLKDMSDKLCLTGINTLSADTLPSMPKDAFSIAQNNNIYIKFPYKNRYLIISQADQAISLWTDLITMTEFKPISEHYWIDQDISAGIPWLNQENSEEYIPQMLNIDKLGGISFNKGCYTGQEIIARTHYLGKTKRELFLAFCSNIKDITVDTQIIADNSEHIAGKILSLQSNGQLTKLLIVLQSADSELKNLMLNNSNVDKINLIDFQ